MTHEYQNYDILSYCDDLSLRRINKHCNLDFVLQILIDCDFIHNNIIMK